MANSVCLHHIRPEIESKKTEKRLKKMKILKCYERAPLQWNMQLLFRKYRFFKKKTQIFLQKGIFPPEKLHSRTKRLKKGWNMKKAEKRLKKYEKGWKKAEKAERLKSAFFKIKKAEKAEKADSAYLCTIQYNKEILNV